MGAIPLGAVPLRGSLFCLNGLQRSRMHQEKPFQLSKDDFEVSLK